MPHRVVVEQPALLALGPVADDLAQRVEPLPVAGAQRADRPVAAEHHAVRTEHVERVVDDRRQVVERPLARRRRGDDARDLHDHVLALGDGGDVALPGRLVLRPARRRCRNDRG